MKNLLKCLSCRGSVALITVIIVSAILLLVTLTVSESGITELYKQENYLAETDLRAGAESCLEETILKLEKDTTITTLSITIAEISCEVAINMGTEILISAHSGEYVQNYRAQISIVQNEAANNLKLLKWEKI